MKTVCTLDRCTACNACVSICPKGALHIADDLKSVNAVIDESLCVNCGLCTSVCPNVTPVPKSPALFWQVGWAEDEALRAKGASGGVAAALFKAFVEEGGAVASCIFDKGAFTFVCTESLAELPRFSGSKYVKSDTRDVFSKIKTLLKNGKRVLFLGLPCQVAGALNFVGAKLRENLYTAELICHGTPSKRLFDLYMTQKKIDTSRAPEIAFRQKIRRGISIPNTKMQAGIRDRYTIAFMNGLNLTENCYHCPYSTKDRVSDLVLGDAWGTESREELERGISLIGCQTEKGKYLLDLAALCLREANIEKEQVQNSSLRHPSKRPQERDAFFEGLGRGASLGRLVFRCYPKSCTKQFLKIVAKKCGIKR